MQESRVKYIFIVLASLSVLTGALLVTLYFAASNVTLESLRNDAFFIYDSPIEVGEFELADDQGQPFTRESLAGKWSLVFFGYTFCPDICPITMASIRQFYGLLDENQDAQDVQVIMISVDTERDTQEVLANYVGYFNPDFIGASGEYAETYTLARQMNVTFNYTRIDDDNYLVNHNGEVMLLDPDGRNVGFFKPPYDPEQMRVNFLRVKRFSASQQ